MKKYLCKIQMLEPYNKIDEKLINYYLSIVIHNIYWFYENKTTYFKHELIDSTITITGKLYKHKQIYIQTDEYFNEEPTEHKIELHMTKKQIYSLHGLFLLQKDELNFLDYINIKIGELKQ